MAALVRVPLAFVADDQFGDAPVRLEIVDRFVRAPGLFWSFSSTFQYGPLPMHVAGLLGLVVGPRVGARALVVVAGIVSVAFVARLAARFSGPRAGLAAGLALAFSPLHLQASTTFGSEAVYLAFAIPCVIAALERRFVVSALFAFGASTTRYDAWLWLPLLGAWWFFRGFPADRRRGFLAAALLGVGPASILLANLVDSGEPLRPLTFIAGEHVALAARAVAEYGSLSWRVSMLGWWPAAMAGLLTPGFAIALLPGLSRAIRHRSEAMVPAAIGLFPPMLYTFKSVIFGNFWPMARFALGPATLLLGAMPALRLRTIAVCVAAAIGTDALIVAYDDGMPGLGLVAAASSPVSRLPADLRFGAETLKNAADDAVLDVSPTYEDILVACAAGRDRWNVEHPADGVRPSLVVALDGGPLDAALRQHGRAFGAAYRVGESKGRVTVWRRAEP